MLSSMVINISGGCQRVYYVCHVEQLSENTDPMVIIEVKKWKTVMDKVDSERFLECMSNVKADE